MNVNELIEELSAIPNRLKDIDVIITFSKKTKPISVIETDNKVIISKTEALW